MDVRRTVAGLRAVWGGLLGLLMALVVVDVVLGLAGAPVAVLPGGLVGLVTVVGGILLLSALSNVAPRAAASAPHVVAPPVRGRWAALNSPGQQLPSHGTRTRGQLAAVDLCAPGGADGPPLVRRAWRGSRPEQHACFGVDIHAMAGGTVVRVRDGRRDHRSRDTWQALAFMLTVEGLLREVGGSGAVLGNHVVVAHDHGTFAAYAHLRHRSARVVEGQRVAAGDVLGQVGATGNASVPHLHVQLMDRGRVDAAAGLPMTWPDAVLTGEIDPPLAAHAKEPEASAVAGMPRNGEVLVVEDSPYAAG